MKALCLRQPWANLILEGKKTIETRKWVTSHRGPLLILTSKMPKIEPYGCAVGVVDLLDIQPMTQDHVGAACCEVYPRAQSWFLGNVRPIKPIPMKGQLSIFNVPLELADLTFL